MISCEHTQEGGGGGGGGHFVPGTERHARLFEVRTRTPEAIMGFHY